jgi:hypothetical protein
MVIDVGAMLGDQCDIDWMVIMRADHDHWNVLKVREGMTAGRAKVLEAGEFVIASSRLGQRR